jgi:hypothetical protein
MSSRCPVQNLIITDDNFEEFSPEFTIKDQTITAQFKIGLLGWLRWNYYGNVPVHTGLGSKLLCSELAIWRTSYSISKFVAIVVSKLNLVVLKPKLPIFWSNYDENVSASTGTFKL